MFERFTDRARQTLVLAQQEALGLRHNFIGTEHILLGLLAEGTGVAAVALGSLEVSLERARELVVQTIGPSLGSARAASRRSRREPRRFSSWRCTKLSVSATTTSEPNTSSWGFSPRARASGRRCSSRKGTRCPTFGRSF